MGIISSDISKAVELLNANEVVAIPTETVYGLAASIYSEEAIRKIFEIKQRPLFNPLIVHIHSPEQLPLISTEIPEKAKVLAKKFWPGPLTMILKKKENISDLLTGGKDTVAVRVPDHPIALELLRSLAFPLAAPSANPFNRISPSKSVHVQEYFKDSIQLVLEGGECKRGIESTIVGFENEKVILYRLGSLSVEELEAAIGKIEIKNKKTENPQAPGMLAKHYSPRTKLILTNNWKESLKEHSHQKVGLLLFKDHAQEQKAHETITLSAAGDLKEAASKLYSALHELDSLDLELIIAERLPDNDLGRSINDRLERAAS